MGSTSICALGHPNGLARQAGNRGGGRAATRPGNYVAELELNPDILISDMGLCAQLGGVSQMLAQKNVGGSGKGDSLSMELNQGVVLRLEKCTQLVAGEAFSFH